MNITEQDKAKAKELANQLKEMATWFSTLASSTEPEEVEIDLSENNPEKRPEWWRELGEGEIIERGDVYKNYGAHAIASKTIGKHYKPNYGDGCQRHLPHYRLRPWRDMEAGEVLQDGDEYKSDSGRWYLSHSVGEEIERCCSVAYRTRRPKAEKVWEKEPELKLMDGTDISGWPVIQEGERVYPGDAYLDVGKWVEYPVARGARIAQRGCLPHRRRVLPCRHCGGNASLSRAKHWYCWSCGCQGPHYDESAVKWNEQNRKEGEE